MNKKFNKNQIIKSFISIFAVFLFNLPTIAALKINYQNIFTIPSTTNELVKPADNTNPKDLDIKPEAKHDFFSDLKEISYDNNPGYNLLAQLNPTSESEEPDQN